MKLAAGQYYGNIKHSFNYNGLLLSKSYYGSGKSLPVHHHENPYFCYVLKGGYREQSHRLDEYCSKGDIIFHPSETEHTDTFTDVSVCFNIELTGNWIDILLENSSGFERITKTSSHRLQGLVLKIYNEVNDPDELTQLVTESVIMELIESFSQSNTKFDSFPSYLKNTAEYILKSGISNPTLSELSQIAGVSPEHLAREFKNKYKTTIGEYIRNIKIACAVDMLRGDKTLAEIAYESGFSDQSHFTRTLRKVMGVTPGFYRNIS